MYGKVFDSMFDGTLASRGPWQALVTFQQMIVLADKNGMVDMTADAIARRTSIPLEIIEIGLSELAKPDARSRSPDEDGRRIVLLDDHRDWGWQIVNHAKYQAMRSSEERREYLRKAQADRRSRLKADAASTSVNNVNTLSAKINTSTPEPAAASASEEEVKEKHNSAPKPPKGEGRFPDFWSAWPSTDRKQDRKRCLAKWQRGGFDKVADRIVAHVTAAKTTKKWIDGFEPAPLTYLNGERWADGVSQIEHDDIFAGAK